MSIAATLVATLAILTCATPAAAQPARAPLHYSARLLDGGEMRVGAGEPPTLVAVFATWCATCRTEFGTLDSLRRALQPRGIRVLALSVDEGDDARVRRYVSARKTQVAVAHDGSGAAGRAFGLVGVPESFLVDGEGAVRWHGQGELRTGLPALGRAVRSLAAVSAADARAPRR